MKLKKHSLSLALRTILLTLFCLLSVQGFPQGTNSTLFEKATAQQAAQRARSEAVQRNMMPRLVPLGKKFPTVPQTITRRKNPAAFKKEARKTPQNKVQLWGNIIQVSDSFDEVPEKGMYSFNADSDMHFTQLSNISTLNANGGGAYFDKKLHMINYYSEYGRWWADYYEYSYEDGWKETQTQKPDTWNVCKVMATDVTYDATTGNTYGFFAENSPTNPFVIESHVIGIINYETLTRTSIATCDKFLVAMAANKQGELYGISDEASLYKINKETGELTLVGATGIISGSYNQSAAFDMKTGILYWVGADNEGNIALYTVDTATGAATKITDMPHNAQVVALYVPEPEADDGAPAAITDLKATFEPGSTEGYITFTAPSTTYGNEPLNGSLTYSIEANGKEVATGSCEAGSQVKATVTIPDGKTKIGVTTTNEAGTSPQAQLTLWIGNDEPKPATNVVLKADSTKLTLTWNAPTEGLNGEYFSAENISYDIVRLPDTAYVAHNFKGTTWTEDVSGRPLQPYYYAVTAVNGSVKGSASLSNKVVVGDPLLPPFFNDFNSENDFLLFTTLDNDSDNKLWSYSSLYKAAQSPQNKRDGAVNDWLLTPPLKMYGGRSYTISYKIRAGLPSYYTERFESAYGEGDNTDNYIQLQPPTELKTKGYTEYRHNVIIDHDGTYKFGIHAISNPNCYVIFVDSIYVSAGAAIQAPDSVNSLTLVAAPLGELKVTGQFYAPTRSVEGNALSQISRIDILRNDTETVKSIYNAEPGTLQTFEDEKPQNGINRYTVIPYNGELPGERRTDSVYVGQDTPLPPANAQMADNGDGTVTAKWEYTGNEGINGYYVDPTLLTYNVYTVDNASLGSKIGKAISATEFTHEENTEDGSQHLLYYAITAENVAGESKPAGAEAIVAGTPFTIPFHESFRNGTSEMGFWWTRKNIGSEADFQLEKTNTYDNDGGSVLYMPAKAGEGSSFNSGKISMKDAHNPRLTFAYYAAKQSNAYLKVIINGSGKQDTEAGTINFKDDVEETGWHTAAYDLTPFADNQYIILKFKVVCNGDSDVVCIDDINVDNTFDNDLAVTLDAPKTAVAGQKIAIHTTVKNLGNKVSDNYKVCIYAKDELVGEISGNQLNPAEEAVYESKILATLYDDSIKVFARVLPSVDDFAGNNQTEQHYIAIKKPEFPTVTLTASNEDGANVVLDWSAPDGTEPLYKTDDFENYNAWSIDNIGDWQLLDGDKAITYGINGYSWNHEYKPQSFIVFNPSDIGINTDEAEQMKPHSGSQFLACFAASPNYAARNDDYLISPVLPGVAQTISFYAKSLDKYYPETFEVLAYNNTIDPENFVQIDSVANVSGTWTEYSYNLPEDTRYFIIHVVSSDCYALCIDDVTFSTIGTSKVKGYNIYRNGSLIASVDSTTLHYEDVCEVGDYTYNVTAIYNEGESDFSNTVTASITTAIEEPNNLQGETFDIFSADGKEIARNRKDIFGLQKGIYILRTSKGKNRKIAIK